MYTVRGTKRFLDRAGRPVTDVPEPTNRLGDWYANALLWRPQVALFVNTATFVPVLVPLAPVVGVVARFPAAMAEVMDRLGIDRRFTTAELGEMEAVVLAKTDNRQVLGVMNEFTFMAEHSIGTGRHDPSDLAELSCWLADTIVGPLTKDDRFTPLGALRRILSVEPTH